MSHSEVRRVRRAQRRRVRAWVRAARRPQSPPPSLVELAAACGVFLEPWQQQLLDRVTAEPGMTLATLDVNAPGMRWERVHVARRGASPDLVIVDEPFDDIPAAQR